MASKTTNKTQPSKRKNDKPMNNQCVLLRDSSSKLLLVVGYNHISVAPGGKIAVGKEVSYTATERIRGRGVIILIGLFIYFIYTYFSLCIFFTHLASDEDCTELLLALEKTEQSKNAEDSRSVSIAGDQEQTDDIESDYEEVEESEEIEKNDTVTSENRQSGKPNTTKNDSRSSTAQSKLTLFSQIRFSMSNFR